VNGLLQQKGTPMVHDGREDNEGRLQELVERFRERLDTQERERREHAARYFHRRLVEEAKRCERYNHFCTVVVLGSDRASLQLVCDRLKGQLRETDIVEVVRLEDVGASPEPGASSPAPATVATILPETDRSGSGAVLQRIEQSFVDMTDVRFGVSVYPDDATDPIELLKKAAEAVA
jgi:hypothetical protein